MKKTITINLAGMVYHIEEDGYEILRKYIADIKRVFAKQEGVEEMVSDIEVRIAELFSERLSINKEVVTHSDVEEVIAIMGSPNQFDEDYDSEDEETSSDKTHQESFHEKSTKRLYRDTDEGMLAGVSAGMAHYFNIDPVIIRVLWIVLVIAGGSGILIYIIAWIAIPEAKTTAQKLQMRGQSANLDNIKAFADSVKEEAKTGFKRASQSVKDSMKKSNNVIVDILKVFGKIIGLGMFVGGIIGLVALVMLFWTDTSIIHINNELVLTDVKTAMGLIFTDSLLATWVIFIVAAIPLMFLIVIGEMLTFNRKKKSRAFILTLLIVWFAAIMTFAFLGAKTGLEFKETYKTQEKIQVDGDYSEIYVNLFEDDLMITDAMDYSFDQYLSLSENEIKLGYARIELVPAKDSLFYYSIEKRSNGGTLKTAKGNSEEIKYEIQQEGSALNIPTRYSFSDTSRFRGQKVSVKIYVPIGKQITLNGNLEEYPLRVQMKTRFSNDMLKRTSIWEATSLGMEYKGFLE